MDDDTLATVLLAGQLRAGDVEPFKAAEFWDLCTHVGAPGELLRATATEMAEDFELGSGMISRITALVDRATAVAFEIDRLDQSGIATLTLYDDDYPQRWAERLGPRAPAVVHVAGSTKVFGDAGTDPALGVVGSRTIDAAGADVAGAVGAHAAAQGWTVVSGNARGVDQLAMEAANAAGGAVVGILAESLVRAVSRREMRRTILSGRTVMCTPYAPDAAFTAGRAHGRNRLIYALATTTLVVACDDGTGGTWTGATEAITGGWGRVSVWRGLAEAPGAAALASHGATPVATLEELEVR